MSKKLKNYPDPNLVMSQHGADPLRLFLLNSPVVRGDNLRFRESGVKDVVGRVLLPWLNSYRFFLGQVALLKKESGFEFRWDQKAKVSDNVMDRWILARCQTLIKAVKTEMEAYRLYTVMSQMLTLIDELTNWYIRFNRRRLKGENGREDTIVALNTLFETLLTLCRTLASFTPFLTENIYQGLRQYLPEQVEGFGRDLRSIHFLSFPQPRHDYFDEVIERRVSRMQTVISLCRTIRERNNLSLKTPLREMVIFHSELEYHDDVKILEHYIKDELNVHGVRYTCSERECGVKYKATADWATLGKKLRRDLGKVKKALLEQVTSEQVKAYIETGTLKVEGIELVKGDLMTQRYVDVSTIPSSSHRQPEEEDGGEAEAKDKLTNYLCNTDEDVVILLDVTVDQHLELEGFARELMNRIQKLRKKAGLLQTDDHIHVYFRFLADSSAASQAFFNQVVQTQQDVLKRVMKHLPKPESERSQHEQEEVVLLEEEQEKWGDQRVALILCRSVIA